MALLSFQHQDTLKLYKTWQFPIGNVLFINRLQTYMQSTLYTGHAHKLHRSDYRGHNTLCYLFLFSYCTVEPEQLSVYTSVMTIGTTPLDNDFCISCFDQELVKTI